MHNPRSKDLPPGTVVTISVGGGEFSGTTKHVLSRRKDDNSGWWCERGGGFRDDILDGYLKNRGTIVTYPEEEEEEEEESTSEVESSSIGCPSIVWYDAFWDNLDEDEDDRVSAVRLIGEMFSRGVVVRNCDELLGYSNNSLDLDVEDHYLIRRIEAACDYADNARNS